MSRKLKATEITCIDGSIMAQETLTSRKALDDTPCCAFFPSFPVPYNLLVSNVPWISGLRRQLLWLMENLTLFLFFFAISARINYLFSHIVWVSNFSYSHVSSAR
ncbi:hypothetical protein CEXT_482461 [Caerostris extrusa]|uniref:Uncharacterized protein n=1 Tax=Caerostris extrusa TaxID=172846 RepID=A0AAV4NWR4_CAEEX|nr:hypothetical protein CEXT_482461 [Caerostris extrusa]